MTITNNALIYRQFGDPQHVLQFITTANYDYNSEDSDVVVKMIASPINPSDLIPITGAYQHRITLPLVAGYEGVGIVVKSKNASLIGKRVLPLRGSGTWQNYVTCHQHWAVPVPDFIHDDIASRGYINPLAAYLMLNKYSVTNKNIIITAGGSSCAAILIQLAQNFGAKRIVTIYRSPNHLKSLTDMGVIPISIYDDKRIAQYSFNTDYVFDAVGGDLATFMLQALHKQAVFISYGLLSGKLYSVNKSGVLPIRFHIRDSFPTMTVNQWQNYFSELWLLLPALHLPKVEYFNLNDWPLALTHYNTIGRLTKPVLVMS